ncbi:hypothetical protein M3231_12390 [Neobacillus mesonae]|nr:hypothetical protein [Neobacillus mesonae]
MSYKVIKASMGKNENNEWLGSTVFVMGENTVEYEISFFSKNGKDWDYSLHFADEPGEEEEFLKLDAQIEEDDELFDDLLDAAIESIPE